MNGKFVSVRNRFGLLIEKLYRFVAFAEFNLPFAVFAQRYVIYFWPAKSGFYSQRFDNGQNFLVLAFTVDLGSVCAGFSETVFAFSLSAGFSFWISAAFRIWRQTRPFWLPFWTRDF